MSSFGVSQFVFGVLLGLMLAELGCGRAGPPVRYVPPAEAPAAEPAADDAEEDDEENQS